MMIAGTSGVRSACQLGVSGAAPNPVAPPQSVPLVTIAGVAASGKTVLCFIERRSRQCRRGVRTALDLVNFHSRTLTVNLTLSGKLLLAGLLLEARHVGGEECLRGTLPLLLRRWYGSRD